MISLRGFLSRSKLFLLKKRSPSLDENPFNKVEPGACDFCFAPCTSCLHLNKTQPLTESEFECKSFLKMSARKEDDSCSSVGVSEPAFQSEAHSEQNHLCPFYKSSLVGAESRPMVGVSTSSCASTNLNITLKSSTDALDEDKLGSPSVSCKNLNHRKTSDLGNDMHKIDGYGSSVPCSSGSEDGSDTNAHNMEIDKDMRDSSTSSDALLVKGKEKAIQNTSANAHDNEDREKKKYKIEQLRKSNAISPTLVKKDGTQDVSEDGQCLLLKSNTDPEAQTPCSVSQTDYSHTDNSRDLERIENSECSEDKKEEQLTGELVASSVYTENFTLLPNCIDSTRNDRSTTSASTEEVNLFSQRETVTDSKLPIETVQISNMSEQSAKLNSSNHVLNDELYQENQETVPGIEASEEIIDDVKICDICGDAGQEENLAPCSRCSDGAEHIYCMRIRLFKLPECDWLCEECQMKEDSQNQDAQRSEGGSLTKEQQSLNGKNQQCGSKYDSKYMLSSETKETDPHLRDSIKEPPNTKLPSKKSSENPEAALKLDERKSEAHDVSTGTSISRKTTLLSRENSFNKADPGKPKVSNLSTGSGQSEKLSHVLTPGSGQSEKHALTRSLTALGTNSFKTQACTESIKGSLSKSFSFNSSKVPKVKQLTELVPQKQKFTREPASRSTRKEGPVRTMPNSASFRNVNSGGSKVDNKVESLLKERSAVDEKISSLSDHPSSNPSAITPTNISSVKVNEKIAQVDGKAKKIPESTNSCIRKGSVANSLGKKHLPQVRNFEGQSIFKSEEQNASPLTPKSSDTMHRDEKRKEPSVLNSSRLATSSGNRILRCRRCNETGHSTQFCAVDKLCASALKPSSEWNTKEGANKSHKQKDAVEMANLKLTRKKTGGSLDKSEEVSTSSADINPEVTSKVASSTSLSSSKILPSLKASVDAKVFGSSSAYTKVSATINEKQKAVDRKKTLPAHKKNDLNTLSKLPDNSTMKTNLQSLPEQAMMGYILSATVIPQFEFIWQGAFEVLRAGKLPTIYDGFQAHFSCFVSPKAADVAAKFPYRIQLDEVSRKSSWPSHFQETNPKEDDVALFFFAKDKQSYEKCYTNLLDNMVKNDLALRGSIDAVQLLIFPSNLLPEDSRRWNNFNFLWGVFKVEETNNVENLLACGNKPSITNLSQELVEHDLSTKMTSELSTCQDANNKKDMPRCEILSIMSKASNSTSCLELPDASGTENMICKTDDTLATGNFSQTVADGKKPLEQPSPLFPPNGSSNGTNHLPGFLASSSKRKIMIDIEQLPPEEKDDCSYLKQPEYESVEQGEKGQLYEDHAASLLTCHPTKPLYSVSSSHMQETRSERSATRSADEYGLIKDRAALVSILPHTMLETDHRSLESTHRKHVYFGPTDIVGHHFSCLAQPNDKEFPLEESSCTLATDEKEHKRRKLDKGGHVSYVSNATLPCDFSRNILPLTCSLREDKIYAEKASMSSNSAERFLLSVDEGPTTSTKVEDTVHVIYSDDEPPEPDVPDLTLALGTHKSSHDKLSAPVDVGDGDPALLSLSLAFPAPQKPLAVETVSQGEQILPNKPSPKKSWFLFGDLNET